MKDLSKLHRPIFKMKQKVAVSFSKSVLQLSFNGENVNVLPKLGESTENSIGLLLILLNVIFGLLVKYLSCGMVFSGSELFDPSTWFTLSNPVSCCDGLRRCSDKGFECCLDTDCRSKDH